MAKYKVIRKDAPVLPFHRKYNYLLNHMSGDVTGPPLTIDYSTVMSERTGMASKSLSSGHRQPDKYWCYNCIQICLGNVSSCQRTHISVSMARCHR